MRYEPKPYELPLALLEGIPRMQKEFKESNSFINKLINQDTNL